jgi:hypothetical protein
LADTGPQNITVAVAENEKEFIAVMATLTLTKANMPIVVLGKRFTDRCGFTQLGELGSHQGDHSSTRWMTEQAIRRYRD